MWTSRQLRLMSLEGEALAQTSALAPLWNQSSSGGEEGEEGERGRHHTLPWAVALLAGVLITTIVVDVIGNMLVIVSVFRNRKLRKAGEPQRHTVSSESK
uniref:Uncharacterized protein n=1 Tax=Knipowitschia caucasica TaxID=637954 RepID=A0AAV2MIE4_KNICA